jgi:hypothetical protein
MSFGRDEKGVVAWAKYSFGGKPCPRMCQVVKSKRHDLVFFFRRKESNNSYS